MSGTTSLASIPQEVLEHIALFAATQCLVGPPSGLVPLLQTCQDVYGRLSFEANPCLYARIFTYKFDTKAAIRRLGPHVAAPQVLADELRKRCIHLKRIRARSGSRASHTHASPTLIDLLWLAYLMMLENDGKNEQQLLDYAEMDAWLMEYWFHEDGASSAARMVLRDVWPPQDANNSIAMWLFWFLFRPDLARLNATKHPYMSTVLKLTALAANHYPICHPTWTEFLPESHRGTLTYSVTHFSGVYRLNPPTLAPAAILSFLTLTLRALVPSRINYTGNHTIQAPASLSLDERRSEQWDADWHRCVNLAQARYPKSLSGTYVLGSIGGIWEGAFTYTEFSAYTALLSGGAPRILDHCLVARHQQTWKLREYHLTAHQLDNGMSSDPLGPGDPLKAYFPTGTRIQELSDSVEIRQPGREDVLRYRRQSPTEARGHNIVDVIVLGEGHSAWGQFNLYGRVRPSDGLVSLSKEYVEGDRGRWLYRGYLVGNLSGHIAGRWRDTLSPSDISGYEGCFVMSRRR